ncbi:MAG: ABC transporter permease [Thermoplasmatota archaeon]
MTNPSTAVGPGKISRHAAFSPRLALRVWQREVDLYKRIWASTILSNLLDPLFFLLAMGYGLGAYLGNVGGVSYLQFVAPGLVASAVMMAATYEVAWNSYVRIYVERSYEAMMTTPATLHDIVAGELCWAATRSVIYGTVLLVVLWPFGLLRSPWAIGIIPVAIIAGFLFASLGLAYTSLVQHMDQLTFYFTLFTTPMFLFSGIFFPLDRLPLWVREIANVSPLYHVVVVVRGFAFGQVDAPVWIHLGVLVAAAILFFPLPGVLLRRRLLQDGEGPPG